MVPQLVVPKMQQQTIARPTTQLPQMVPKAVVQQKTWQLPVKPISITLNRIKTVDDANRMEQWLKNVGFKKQLSEQLIRQFGTNVGIGSGKRHVAFDLKARMFENSFFTNCTWTGYSPNEQRGMVAFQSFERLIELFWKIVNNADQTFTMDDNKCFFQKIIRRKYQYNDDNDDDDAEGRAASVRKRIRSHDKILLKIGSDKKKQRIEILGGSVLIQPSQPKFR